MASYLDRLRSSAGRAGCKVSCIYTDDLSRLLHDRDCLDGENDELRRENERLLKALAELAPQHATFYASVPEPEMCCGGTCVRAVCFIHGAGNG